MPGLGGLMAGFQQQMQSIKAQAAATVVVGEAGGGLVKVHATGGLTIERVEIDASVADDTEMLEDLLVVATNDALRKAQEISQQGMSGLLAGLPIPPGLMP
ncbi:MAG: YbaB/EbfC family nucleoid-associated protein [Deltaproteobacteria bacterium]|nr:YbaB/EbfC family nucleoid-associated protein [Deltaproteobacteria bacterium]